MSSIRRLELDVIYSGQCPGHCPRKKGEMPRWNVHFDTVVQTQNTLVVDLLAQAKALASVVRLIPIPPYIQQRIDQLNIIRAVRGTTGIEGTELSEDEVAKIVAAAPNERVLTGNRAREEQEVRNAERLMRYVAETVHRDRNIPVAEPLIRTFHQITTRDIDYPNNVPGHYRTFAVSAGDYVPPASGEEISKLMARFIEWFNSGPPSSWDPAIRAIVAHFYLVSIHSFADGNGRTSRGIESYLLYQAGLTARGFYSLANYYYRNRPEYIEMLTHVRFKSDPDLTPFVLFALQGLVEELQSVHAQVIDAIKIISFRDFAREQLAVAGRLGTPAGERQLLFLLELEEEVVSLKALRSGKHKLSRFYKGVTTKTLTRDIHFLRENQLIIVAGDELRANLGIMTQFPAQDTPTPRLRHVSASPKGRD